MIKNVKFSIDYQVERLRERYKNEINAIRVKNDNKIEFYDLLLELRRASRSLKGTNLILPFYYVMTKDYHKGWVLLNYLNIRFALDTNIVCGLKGYHVKAKAELESPVVWDMKPLWHQEQEERIMSMRGGATCFRLTDDYIPKALDDIRDGLPDDNPYDISPEARYRTVNKIKNYHLSYESLYRTIRLLEIYFRQERIAETEECLFRLRHIVGRGEAPKYMIEHLKVRQTSALINMYDCWYQGRHEADPTRRTTLGWMALYWYLELGFQLLGDSNIDEFVHFSDGCEIIGEFELMGDDQEEFLRHLKLFVMHASVSFCKKMIASPIQVIPFAERNMPGYEEFQAIMNKKHE